MASEPTDLIREADERHQPACPTPLGGRVYCKWCDLEWPCEVRRLRDALAASEAEVAEAWEQANRMDDASATVIRMMSRDWQKTEDERDEARAALAAAEYAVDNRERALGDARALLAEANATIERVRALADKWQAHERVGPTSGEYGMRLRRAIEGPAT